MAEGESFFEERIPTSLPLGLPGPLRTRGQLRLWRAGAGDSPAIMWRINGYRASLLVWTQDEWAKLDVRPADAQYHPSGIWCALRIE
jgi:hypothetical protein